MNAYIAVVLKGYPRLSETFIAQEIYSLQQAGYRLHLVSLRQPTDHATHPVHERIKAPVLYLPEYLHLAPWRVLKALFWAAGKKPMIALIRSAWRDWRRDPTRNRLRRLGQALVMARELPEGLAWVYAHFLHTPASVAMYASDLRQVSWSASAHAKDIWTSPEWELRDKLRTLSWLVTCTRANEVYLSALVDRADKVVLQYHGLDLTRFDSATVKRSVEGEPLTVLSVGRAVPKKGYPVLLRALAALPREIDWRFCHIGGGAELKALKALAAQLGITERIHWQGAQAQSAVLEAYRQADVFVLASVITEDGDRDGMPNVLMEAQSQGVCCVASDISGVPELIEHEATGILVPSGDDSALCAALADILGDADKRQRLAAAGQQRVQREFSHRHCMQPLLKLLGDTGRG